MNRTQRVYACIRDQITDARCAKIHAADLPEGDQRSELEEYGRACAQRARSWFARRHDLPLGRYGYPKH